MALQIKSKERLSFLHILVGFNSCLSKTTLKMKANGLCLDALVDKARREIMLTQLTRIQTGGKKN